MILLRKRGSLEKRPRSTEAITLGTQIITPTDIGLILITG